MKKYRPIGERAITASGSRTAEAPKEAFLQFIDDYESNLQGDISITEQTIDDEFNAYVDGYSKRQAAIDPIKFWEVSTSILDSLWYVVTDVFKANREIYPTIFKIALDYLPVQASSVPCERVFSSSADTDTKKRNRIKSDLMEALQLLKYGYKKERLHFTAHLLTAEEEMIGTSPDLIGKDSLAERLLKDGQRGAASIKGDEFF